MKKLLTAFLLTFSLAYLASAQQHDHDHGTETHDSHNHDHDGHDHDTHAHGEEGHAAHDHAHSGGHAHTPGEDAINSCGVVTHHGEFDPGALAFHHISDQNVYNIGPLQLPLPCILHSKESGIEFFSSGKFHPDYHGTGTFAYNKYVLFEGLVRRIQGDFPSGLVEIGHGALGVVAETIYEEKDGKQVEAGKKDVVYLCHSGAKLACDNKSTLDFGVFGGGLTSFTDFSITKNVVSMFIVLFLMSWLFLSIAKKYKEREGMAPKGAQGLLETVIVFIQDEVAKPFLGHKWEKFLPFLLVIFFFILGLNLWGQVPFLGGSNVTGSLSVTFVLAIMAFLVTNLNGNKHYWEHVFWMPGVPAWIKTILTPVEFLGVFIKPLTLMLRLFANITAGHMVMVIFVSLIFVFSKSGESVIGGYGSSIASGLLTVFMMAIELLVAFIQAFVFTILTASYIGAATEEHHHAEEHH